MSKIQSNKEEYYNALTHGFGIILSLIGLVFLLLNYNSTKINFIYILIYGLSLIVLFSASTLYHSVKNVAYKRLLRKFDHISIYMLIAGTYTPVCMTILKDSHGDLILAIVWGLSLLGLVLKLFFTGKFEKISLLLYLAMGWLIVIDIDTLYQNMDALSLLFLGLGGLFYTLGVIFYVMHKLKYHHVIWHVFVLLGSLSHFLMIYEIIS
ncbi:PAQR family membrane homeostasis protein TrhA [Psychroflexus sp. MBR-150]